jgi:hypothetical protein
MSTEQDGSESISDPPKPTYNSYVKPLPPERPRKNAFSKRSYVVVASLIPLCVAAWLLATHNVFGLGDNNSVATKITELSEETLPGALDFSPDGKRLAVDSFGNSGTNIWELKTERVVGHLPEGGTGIWNAEIIRFSPNGRYLAICHSGDYAKANVEVYDTSTWTKIQPIGDVGDKEQTSGNCVAIGFTPDGKELIRIAHRDIFRPGNNIIFYDTSSWKVARGIRTMPLFTSNTARFDAFNATLIPTSDTIAVDPARLSAFHPNTLSISKDGKYLALAGSAFAVRKDAPVQAEVVLIDIANGSLARVILGQAEHGNHVVPAQTESLDWSPNNRLVAFGPVDDTLTLKLFDVGTGDATVTQAGGPAHVLVRYTSDGRYLIEKIGKAVEIWDGNHQKLLQVIRAEPSCIAVSRDGHYFAMGGAPPSLLDGNALVSLLAHPNGPNGKVLIYKLI